MAKNTNLSAAKTGKNDEFYTQLSDIEKELHHYRAHFKGKTVLCNCDDPFESNFFKYFVLNFNRLGLKKLISTCYAGSSIMGSQLKYHENEYGQMYFLLDNSVDETESKKPYKAVITCVYDKTGDGGVDMIDVAELFNSGENTLTELEGDGDFRSDECIELLEEADIVVTNPPFSLFREYVAQLMKYDKKFIIIGNINALKYADIFPLIQSNKLWAGIGFNITMEFLMSDAYSLKGKAYIDENGKKHGYVPGIAWYTNLDIKKRHENLILVKKYSPEAYIHFDNYAAINIDKVSDIPCDYSGIMGVPITFMSVYNPEQFEMYGRTGNIEWATSSSCSFFTPPSYDVQQKYKKQNKTWRVQNGYYVTKDGIAHTVYDRLFIRNKHPEQPKGDK